MTKIIKTQFFLFLIIISILILNFSFDEDTIIINAKIEPNTVYVNEEFKIIVTIESNSPLIIQEIPSFDKFDSIKQIQLPIIEEKQEASFLNKKFFAKYTTIVTFFLISYEETNIQGSSFVFKINDKIHILKDFFIPIVSKANYFDELDFQNILSFIYEPKEIYIGQPFVCEWSFFSKKDIEKIQLINFPIISGATYLKIDLENMKDRISIFDEQINKYYILKLLVFPDKPTVIFDKFEIKIEYYQDNTKKEALISFPFKKILINPIPKEDPNFFGLIGNYQISYSYNRVENKNSLYYIFEIIFKGKGNHKYINYKNLKIVQQYFNIFGPDIFINDSEVILDYYMYPKQTGFIFFNQIPLSVFNPDKKEFDNFIIPKSGFYINQNFDQIFSNFNFSKNNVKLSYTAFSKLQDYLYFIDIWAIIIVFIILIILLISLTFFNRYFSSRKGFYKTNNSENIISMWNLFIQKYKINSKDDFNIWYNKQNKKTKILINNVYEIYCSFFNNQNMNLSDKNTKKLVRKFKLFLQKNKI